VIFNQVSDTTFKDTTTLLMELRKRLSKLELKKKAPREGHLLSEQPFLDIFPIHRVPPDFDLVVDAFPSLGGVPPVRPKHPHAARKEGQLVEFADILARSLQSSNCVALQLEVEEEFIQSGQRGIIVDAKATAHSTRTSHLPTLNRPATIMGRTCRIAFHS
jgi:hypothetical protein